MPDYGLINGIGQGLQTAFKTYINERNRHDSLRQQNLANALKLREEGVQIKSGTEQSLNPELESSGGNEQYSGLLRNVARDQLKTVHPDYNDEQLDQMIPQGLSAAQYEKAAGLLKPSIGAFATLEGRKVMANAMQGRNQIMSGNLDLNRAKAASGISDKVNKDKVVQATDLQQAAIAKGLDRLNSNQPMTPQMLNEVQMDLANAITGGRVAAQGTVHRVEMQNMAQKMANLQQYLSSNPTDVNSPGIKKYLKQTFDELNQLNQKIREKRVKNLTGQAKQAYGTQGPFGGVISDLEQNANGENQIVSPEQQFSPDVLQYAKAHNISPEQAQAIKLQRSGK